MGLGEDLDGLLDGLELSLPRLRALRPLRGLRSSPRPLAQRRTAHMRNLLGRLN